MFHMNRAEEPVLLYRSVPELSLSLFHLLQGEYEFSPEILSGKLAEVVYRDAAGKIQGRELQLLHAHTHGDATDIKLSVFA